MRPFELKLGNDPTDVLAPRLTLTASGELTLHQRNATSTCSGVYIDADDARKIAREFNLVQSQESQ